MATGGKTESKHLITLQECLFWDEDDPRSRMVKSGKTNYHGDLAQVVDLSRDSYIWAFTGTRGAGKSITMTYYAIKSAYLWGKRILSNYPVECLLQTSRGLIHVKAEPLDMYKLLCFDNDYRNCLILIDEAPDIISHMASQSWKNRLLNIFVRQLRKNMNSLFLGCQQFSSIDKGMRWQTDVLVTCQDAFRLYGGGDGLERGVLTLIDLYDNSGQWTGEGCNVDLDWQLKYYEPADSVELPGSFIWECFDTYHEQDVFESLKKVDMKLMTYKVGDKDGQLEMRKEFISNVKSVCLPITSTINNAELYEDIGIETPGEKRILNSWLIKSNVKMSKNAMYRDFSKMNREKFVELVDNA